MRVTCRHICANSTWPEHVIAKRPRALHTARRQTKGDRMNYLDFEKPLAEIEGKAEELRALARRNDEMDVEQEAAALDKKAGHAARPLQVAYALAEMPG